MKKQITSDDSGKTFNTPQFWILEFFFLLLFNIKEKAMATHSSILAWKIPWTEEPGRLQSMGSRRVGHDWATSLSLFTFTHWRRKWQPTPVFLPEESQGRGSLVRCHLWGLHRVGHDWSDLAAVSSYLFGHWKISFLGEGSSFFVSKRLQKLSHKLQ